MLERLQQQLHDINRSDAGYDIHDFLVTDAHVARAISGGDTMTNSGETLLLCEDEHGVALSLYLDEALLDRLRAYKVRPAPGDPPGKYETGTQNHSDAVRPRGSRGRWRR